MKTHILTKTLRCCMAVVASLTIGISALHAIPAFPGAEGFGANATGARGGSVYIVTNLNDSGSGSFRDAVSQPNRTVVFALGGVIRLTSPVSVKANLTIAGQTAPGEGITLYGNRLSFVDANNTIVRYLRVREGINGDSGTDTISFDRGQNMIFDHVSASWGRDETFSMNGSGVSNVTLQDCIIGQGLMKHSAGGLIQTGGGVSIFRSLYIDHWMRNPKIKGVNDYQNNVVYNWGGGGGYIPGGDSAGMTYANMIGCYFIAGPDSPSSPFSTGNQNYNLFQANNREDMNRDGMLNGVTPALSRFSTLKLVDTPFDYPAPATVLSPEAALEHIITYAGSSLHRDHADRYMIDEALSYGTRGALIWNESEIGGIGAIDGGIAAKDTDGDGMPDWWEQAAGTDPNTPDAQGDIDGDGYTNIENYINALTDSGVPGAIIIGISPDTGVSGTDGITAAHNITLHGTAVPNSTVTLSRVDTGVIGTTSADAAGNWSYDYTSATLADRYYAFIAKADLGSGKISPPSRAYVVQIDSTAAATPEITGLVTTPAFIFNGTSEPYGVIVITQQGGSTVATTTADGYGKWQAPLAGAPLTPGTYTFTAIATDRAGNTSPASVTYTVDTSLTAPVFTGITTDTGISANDQITNDQTLLINGTAPANATITVSRADIGVIGTTTAAASGTWIFDYTSTTLSEGKYTLTATASTGGASSPVSAPFLITIDKTAPTIATITRLNPVTASTSATTLVYRITFTEDVTGVLMSNFTLTKATGVTGTITNLAPIDARTYDITVTGASGDGTLRLDRASGATNIKDLAGNAGSSSTYTGGQTYTLRLAGSGVWANADSGTWDESSNWEADIISTGAGATADFSARDSGDDIVVLLDTPRTVGRLVFGDTDESTPGTWTLADSGSNSTPLTLSMTTSAAPTIQTIYATGADNPTRAINGAAVPVLIDTEINTTAGLTKNGWGTLILNKIGTFTGTLTINEGRLKIGPDAELNMTSLIDIKVSSQFEVAGGKFTTNTDVKLVSGTGVGVIVSGGSAAFKKIIPTNARNNLVKVTGGIMTADEIMFERSGDAANGYTYGLVIQGGTSTIGSVGLGTNNSWGAMSVEGGKITITGPLWNAWQMTSARGGQIRVLGGELVSTDTTNGIVMSRKNGTNANNVAELHITSGTVTAQKITLGYDDTVNAGSATINLNSGALYLGSQGIVKNGTGAFAATINLSGGILGADTDWTTAVPLTLSATNTLTLQTADASGNPHDITLNGNLSGAGGFTKSGSGTLILATETTFTGTATINEGTLNLTGNTAANASALILNTGAYLAGTGTIQGEAILAGGGLIAPSNNTLTPITIGTLTKQSTGTVPLVIPASVLTQAHATVTLARYGTTNLTNDDFTPVIRDGLIISAHVGNGSINLIAMPLATSEPNITVTGGGSTAPIVATTAEHFKTLAESATPAVIAVPSHLDLTPLATPVNVASNKTIIGIDGTSTISGALNLPATTTNVLIRGVNIANPAGNGLTLTGATNVLVTQCTFFDCDGTLVSITGGSEKIVLSWNEFYYTDTFTGHRSALRIGNATGETKANRVTLHHNYWSSGCTADMPNATYGYVHMYNNYMVSEHNNTATIVSDLSQILSAHNVYQNMKDPVAKQRVNTALAAGLLRVMDNTYANTTGTTSPGEDTVFVPDYAHLLHSPETIAAMIPLNAGNTCGALSPIIALPSGTAATIVGPTTQIPNGGSFMLAAYADGYTPTTYQWNRNNFPIPGAASINYNVSQAKTEIHAGTYSVSLTLSSGDILVSSGFKVNMDAPKTPTITNHPIAQNVRPGETAIFTVSASGDASLRYQWQKDGANISGATNPTLYVTNSQGKDAGSYQVVVSNDYGTITSMNAALTILTTDNKGGGGAPSWPFFAAIALLLAARRIATRHRK